MELRGPQVLKVLKERRVQQVLKVCKVLPDRKEPLVPRVRKVRKVPRVRKVCRVHRDRQDKMELLLQFKEAQLQRRIFQLQEIPMVTDTLYRTPDFCGYGTVAIG
jgi:hypothetical protein